MTPNREPSILKEKTEKIDITTKFEIEMSTMTVMTKKMEDALNQQVNNELWSGYIYLSMSTFCEHSGFSGMAHWFKQQFEEEQEHAFKIMDFIVDRGGKVVLQPIGAVESEWKSPLHAFEETLKHEVWVTKSIHDLADLAREEKDHAAAQFLNWFIAEQVEEEASAAGIVDKLKIIGDKGAAIFMLDRELGKREDD